MSDLSQQLTQGLHELELDNSCQNKYLDYIQVLTKWNRTYNLTSVRKPEAILVRHIFDSLSIANHICGHRILDVGSGAGLPGIPLAIAFPDKQFVCVDSSGKKARFLFQAKSELALDNVQVVQTRIEEYRPEQCFDMVVSRAFTTIAKVAEMTHHVISKEGQIASMKGAYPLTELTKVKETVEVYPLVVPGLNEKRHVVVLKRNTNNHDHKDTQRDG